jgi:hypothetical protein
MTKIVDQTKTKKDNKKRRQKHNLKLIMAIYCLFILILKKKNQFKEIIYAKIFFIFE